MQGQELINYFREHGQTERALFSNMHVLAMCDLAGVKLEDTSAFISVKGLVLDQLCKQAQANLDKKNAAETPGHIVDADNIPVQMPGMDPALVEEIQKIVKVAPLGVFDKSVKPRISAKAIVEYNFPEEHYGEIMTYEAWPMRSIMENLVEQSIVLESSELDKYKIYVKHLEDTIRSYIETCRKWQEGDPSIKENDPLDHWDELCIAHLRGKRIAGLAPSLDTQNAILKVVMKNKEAEVNEKV